MSPREGIPEPPSRDIRYRSRNPLVRRLTSGFLRGLSDLAGLTGARSVLEIGCGEGFVLDLLRRKLGPDSSVGGDIYLPDLVAAAGRSLHGSLVQLDGRALPFPDRS
ncbi:class I SAM-dependent methyltransferase, partial [Candidatus Fermentibacterales bacterium]|nr:class I SAM-dependent methyltransferase [Candidatus Fermentibacterales bacterium]